MKKLYFYFIFYLLIMFNIIWEKKIEESNID